MTPRTRLTRVLAVGIALLLFAGVARAQDRFTLGSPSLTVAEVQGRPPMVERLRSQGYEMWHYGESWVRVSSETDRVTGWWNADGALKVELRPGGDVTRATTFTAGSSADDLVRLQGTPRGIQPYPESGVALWRYGPSTVRVALADGRVVSWDDPARILRARCATFDDPYCAPGDPMSGRPGASPAGGYQPGGYPATGVPSAPARPGAPPQLDATVRFEDDGGDGVLDGDERAEVRVTLRNRGRGTAHGLSLVLTTPDARGVEIGAGARADSLAPGETTVLRVRLAAPPSLRDGKLRLEVRVREGNGFDLDPAPALEVTTRAFRAPRFVLDGIVVADQTGDGRIAPREIVEVRARVANRGAGEGRDVRAALRLGPELFLTPDSSKAFTFGTMRPGDVRDVVFSAFANSRARDFPVAIEVHEARARFDTVFALPLALDRPIGSSQVVVERTRPEPTTQAPPPLVVDVDTGVPRTHRPAVNAVAVVLGVERYDRLPAVSFAARDAAVFRDYAVRTFGVRDDAEHLYYALDGNVSGTALRKLFSADGWLARRVTPEADVIVYWAGHGGPDLRTRAPFLLPADADANYPTQTGYALRELYERLAALGARSVTVFLDACFSGWTRDAEQLLAGARDIAVSVENPVLTNDRMAVFAASAGNQVSSAWPSMRHGLFTYFLLKGLRGAADTDGTPGVTVGELDAYLRREVPPQAGRLDREQRPQLTAVKTDRVLVAP